MLANLFLLLVSCLAGLSLCELSLRIFYPKYRHLAEAPVRSDTIRLFARNPNSRDSMPHPDAPVPHLLHHNNLALRQHRDFNEADLASATNIGVFGDSFVENIRMPVQYSFTEPLDYLLNQSEKPFNVLNFGVDGYGPGQSFLHYEYFHYAEDLDHVFFVYCENDLREIYSRKLFHLDGAGHLVRNEAIRESWWAPLIRGLHSPYLVLDVGGRMSPSIAEIALQRISRTREIQALALRTGMRSERLDDDDRKDSLKIFRQLIRRWKHLVEHNGGSFSVVLLPDRSPESDIVALLNAEDVEVIDLYDCFGEADPAHFGRPWDRSPYRFKNDGHWNEAANRLAAVCLYRVLEEKTGLPPLSKDRLQKVLFQYYAAFEVEIPLKAKSGGRLGSGSVETAPAIREKYQALGDWNILTERARKVLTAPEKRIIRSVFDIYRDGQSLFYTKEDCSPADTEAKFFLHIIPVNLRDLPERKRQLGFMRRRFNFGSGSFETKRHTCVTSVNLPAYPVRYIRTGQYVPDEGRLWEGEGWIDPHSVGEERPEFPVTAGNRIIQSDFDVYLNGKRLVYHKADCGPADREPPFFLHVTPTDETVLSRDRVQYGYDSLDFNNTCTIERELPAYAIQHIQTGQLTDEGRLWEASVAWDQVGVNGGGNERAAVPQRIVRSVFNVALDGRRLIYSKAECGPVDRQARFFLHVYPVDPADLPPERIQYRSDNLDFYFPSVFGVDEFGCTIATRLPAYPIRHIRTGQSVEDAQGNSVNLWEGEFSMDQGAGVEAGGD